MISKKNKYLDILIEHFFLGEEISSLENNIMVDKESLVEKLVIKEQKEKIWISLLIELRKLSNISIKDFTIASERHAYNGLFMYLNKVGNPSGFIFSISFLLNDIGFYFYNFYPVSEDQFRTRKSYQPLDEEMDEYYLYVLNKIQNHFNGFQLFDPSLSIVKIDKIIIDHKLYTEIDLWNVIFTTNINIIM